MPERDRPQTCKRVGHGGSVVSCTDPPGHQPPHSGAGINWTLPGEPRVPGVTVVYPLWVDTDQIVEAVIDARTRGVTDEQVVAALEVLGRPLDRGNPGDEETERVAAADRVRAWAAGRDDRDGTELGAELGAEAQESIWQAEKALVALDAALARVAELDADQAKTTAVLVDQVGRAVQAEILLDDLRKAAQTVAGLFGDDGDGGHYYLAVDLPECPAPACMAFVPAESSTYVRRLREVLAAQAPAAEPDSDSDSGHESQPR